LVIAAIKKEVMSNLVMASIDRQILLEPITM